MWCSIKVGEGYCGVGFRIVRDVIVGAMKVAT